MNNIEIKLNKLIEIIRKDTGINNTMDVMEQLSAMLLLKYYYDEQKNAFEFKNLFSQSRFSQYSDVLKDFPYNEKIESILNNIPFRIRSEKILDILLSDIENVKFNNELTEVYDKLLVQMINDSSASGAFYSPKVLTKAIVKVISPSSTQTIYDPALGTGRFMIEAQKNLSKPIHVYGQDISPFACLVGSLNLLLNGIDIKNISLGDSLLNNNNLEYDIILSALPFGKVSSINKYNYYYKEYVSNLETMFVKHSMEKLAKYGKAALIVPFGFLFNTSGEFLNLRKELLTEFNLHSILNLPANTLAPYSGLNLSVLFFDNNKIKNDIWFYNLKTDKPLSKSNQIKEQDFEEFIKLFSKRTKGANSYLINMQDILEDKKINLAVEFPEKIDKANNFNVSDEIVDIKEKKEKFNKLVSKFNTIIEKNKKVNFQKTISLGELFTIRSGKLLKSEQIKKEGKYPVYGGNGIRGYYDEYNREGETIIIGRVGLYCGNIHFTKEPIWLASNAFSININSSIKVYLPYLAHALRSLDLNDQARGTAQPAISYEKIKNINISLPSYEQQVELSKWFDEIQEQNENILKLIELQKNKFNDITKSLIVYNCIESNS